MPKQNNKVEYADTLSIVCFTLLIALIVAGSLYNEYKTYKKHQLNTTTNKVDSLSSRK